MQRLFKILWSFHIKYNEHIKVIQNLHPTPILSFVYTNIDTNLQMLVLHILCLFLKICYTTPSNPNQSQYWGQHTILSLETMTVHAWFLAAFFYIADAAVVLQQLIIVPWSGLWPLAEFYLPNSFKLQNTGIYIL